MKGGPNFNFNYNFNFNGTVPASTIIELVKDGKTDDEIAAITGEKLEVIQEIRKKLRVRK